MKLLNMLMKYMKLVRIKHVQKIIVNLEIG